MANDTGGPTGTSTFITDWQELGPLVEQNAAPELKGYVHDLVQRLKNGDITRMNGCQLEIENGTFVVPTHAGVTQGANARRATTPGKYP